MGTANRRAARRVAVLVLLSIPMAITAQSQAKTIIDEWSAVAVPPAPALKEVAIDAAATALLLLDLQKGSCNAQSRPRCDASIPAVKALLETARSRGLAVVHSLTSTAAVVDLRPEVAPREGESVVRSSVDKFYNTELDAILKAKAIKTVIIVGTAAHGAVLHTATGAAMRGMQVIVPVDGMSADAAFAELYTAWHLANSPGTRARTTLTSTSLMRF